MPKTPSFPPAETALLLGDAGVDELIIPDFTLARTHSGGPSRWTASSPRSRQSSASDDHARPVGEQRARLLEEGATLPWAAIWQRLAATRAALLGATLGVSEGQAAWRPPHGEGEEAWSIRR